MTKKVEIELELAIEISNSLQAIAKALHRRMPDHPTVYAAVKKAELMRDRLITAIEKSEKKKDANNSL